MIRAVEAREGPFAGVLVTRGDAVAVRVDAAELTGWDGWRFGGSEHVVGPLDVVRRAQGHDVLLPWCVERVSTFVGRRTAVSEGLSLGECSTLLVSLFRALEELGHEEAVADASGTWWLTDEGRPVLVLGEGEEARMGVALLVAQLGESCADKTLGRLLSVVQEGLHTNLEQQQRRVPRLLLEKWEGEVLEVAAPRALRREAFAPERTAIAARTALQSESLPPASRRSGRAARDGRPPRGRAVDRFRHRIPDARLTRVLSGVLRRLRVLGGRRRGTLDSGRAQRPVGPPHGVLRPRRRSLVVATAAAIAVLLVGTLWPGDRTKGVADSTQKAADSSQAPVPDEGGTAAGHSAAGTRRAAAEAQSSSEPTSSPEASRPAPEAAAPADAATWLLGEIGRCADTGDTVCATAVVAGATAVIASLDGATTDSPRVEIVDEYGDAAVVRVTPKGTAAPDAADSDGTGAERIVVLVRINEKWLVRDVYDVADQPE